MVLQGDDGEQQQLRLKTWLRGSAQRLDKLGYRFGLLIILILVSPLMPNLYDIVDHWTKFTIKLC